MSERTTRSEVTFHNRFILSPLVAPLDAGTYSVVTDEELIEGLSFPAYRRTATYLEIPALGAIIASRQFLKVDPADLESAIRSDAESV
jgi:hypothetical protein